MPHYWKVTNKTIMFFVSEGFVWILEVELNIKVTADQADKISNLKI